MGGRGEVVWCRRGQVHVGKRRVCAYQQLGCVWCSFLVATGEGICAAGR